MIAYANVPLTLDPQIAAEAARWWDEHAQDLFSYPAYLTYGIDHLPIPYPPMRRPPRPGVLVWPNGASRWAQFAAFVTGSQLAQIRSAVGDPQSARTFYMSDDNGNVITADLFLLPPRPCFQSGDAELYLITLVDDRYRWWLKGDQVVPDYENWSDLISGLIEAVTGDTGPEPSFGATVDFEPPLNRWQVGAKPLPILIDAACAATGIRMLRSRTGTITLQEAPDAIEAEETQWSRYKSHLAYGGRHTVADIARATPASVATVFDAGTDTPTIETLALVDLTLTEYGNATGLAGATAQIQADMLASADGADRLTYATAAAIRYYRWALSRVDATFRLLQPWSLTGLEDRIEWEHTAERVLTRVVRSDLADRNLNGGVPRSAGSGRAPFAANLTEATGAASWQSRTLSSGSWSNDSGTGTDNAYPVQCGGAAFTAGATSTSIMWEEPPGSGAYAFLPIQYATTAVPGFMSTGTQSFAGQKTFTNNVLISGAFNLQFTGLGNDAYFGTLQFGASYYAGVSVVSGGFVAPSFGIHNGIAVTPGLTTTFATGDGRTATFKGGILTGLA